MKCFARGTEREGDRERAKSFSLTADQDISPQINVMTHIHTHTGTETNSYTVDKHLSTF